MSVRRGQIVMAAIPDPQGRNVKRRPCVVVSEDASLDAGGPVRLIGVTSWLEGLSGSDRIDLPYSNTGRHPRTGLDRPSAAVCCWAAVVAPDQVGAPIGHVPPVAMKAILDRLMELAREATAVESAPPAVLPERPSASAPGEVPPGGG